MRQNNTRMRRLIPYLKAYRFKITGTILLIIAVSCLIAISPTLEGMITTQLLNDMAAGHGVDFTVIYRIVATLLVVYLTGTLCNRSYQFLLIDTVQSVMVNLRNDVESKIKRLSISYLDQNPLGDTMSRVSNDMETISNALQQSLVQILNAILGLTLAVAMMSSTQWKMALASMLIILGSVVISKLIVKKSQPLFERQQSALGALSGVVQESFTGFNEIRLFGKQEDALSDLMKANNELCRNGFRAQFINGLMPPLISSMTYVGIGCIAIMGALYTLSGVIAVGRLQAFIRYVWRMNQPLPQMAQLPSALQSSAAATHRVFEFLNEQEETEDGHCIPVPEHVEGNVVFDDVHFPYAAEKPLIQGLDANVKSGQMAAIVGSTGVGRTTLINLLMCFYDVTSGTILIDGIDIRHMKRKDLCSKFGMMPQDTWLFKGTIRENIAYGKDDVTDEEAIRATKIANVYHFIATLPEGYDMISNEESSNISQGGKQLLIIARTVLCDLPTPILNEATSSIGTRLKHTLQDAVQNIMKGRTSFVIAHRLSTIRGADLILVMRDGNIVEQGTHHELLEKKGYYEQLYHAQSAEIL